MKKFANLFTATSIVNVLSILLLLGTGIAVIINPVFRFRLNDLTEARYNLTYEANRFMDASAYLTDEVRAYAATGLRQHYDNYWNEVNVLQNRDKGIEQMKQIGITSEEERLIREMSKISDDLVPLEAHAMELTATGDTSGAMDIVYGTYYNESVAQIVSLRNQFLDTLNTRTENEIAQMSRIYDVIDLTTWTLVVGTVLLQILQKRGLHRLAYEDPLTGGDNYTAFREKMRNGAAVSGAGYVISADLQGFSSINDTCGVAKGDEVIREMGKILKNGLEHGELLAHVSGDRFVLFLHSKNREELLERIAALRMEIMELSPLLDVPHIVPLFGIREVDSPAHPERSYGDANLAKRQRVDRADLFYAIFDEETLRRTVEEQRMADSFETALAEHQFEMFYQPKYSPQTGELVAAEALVRWRTAEGMVSPGKFIPLFERNGMIAQLDEYTFETVCAQQRAWLDEGRKVVPVSINVSRASLYYPDIVGRYMVIANRYGVSPDLLDLEITESAIDSTRDIEQLIKQFRSCGFRILVDDFGSGYSSLSTLTKKYFDNIKIDKSLVDCISTPEGNSLLESIVHLAHEFRMTVTAEGVEQADQVEFLLILCCDNIQGFYYSRPLPAPEFQVLLKSKAASV